MKRVVGILALLCAVVVAGGCSQGGGSQRTDYSSAALASQGDSLSYIIGMSIAEQLEHIDSALNIDVVCRAIVDHSAGRAAMSIDEARIAYLRYMLYVEPERRRGYEEQYLADMVVSDRSYKRTKSGLTYSIEVIGDEAHTPKYINDWVTIKYNIARVDGTPILPAVSSDSLATASEFVEESFVLEELPRGVAEALRLIGKGGKIKIWVPSKIAYGDEGNSELGVEPIETLFYQIELLDMESNVGRERRQEQKEREF